MNQESRIRTYWISFFVTLLLLSAAGCSTPQEHRVLGHHLESYRKVYLVKAKEDPRNVTDRISSRLQLAGFNVTEISREMAKTMNKMISEKESREPALICTFECVSVGDPDLMNDYRFQTIHIHFYDSEKSDRVFEVSDFHYYPNLPEDTELNRLFVQISDKFFPGPPNPFIGKK